DLGHQEDLLAVAVLQRLAHPLFGSPFVVVPTVVEKGDPAIDRRADERDAVRFALPGKADMPAAEADGRDAFAGPAECAIQHAWLLRPRGAIRDPALTHGASNDVARIADCVSGISSAAGTRPADRRSRRPRESR